jgi:hypothetical protein
MFLTSNKHFRDWAEILLGNAFLTTAILDRLLHHVAVVNIEGQCYRLPELSALLSPTREGPRAEGIRPHLIKHATGVLPVHAMRESGCTRKPEARGRPTLRDRPQPYRTRRRLILLRWCPGLLSDKDPNTGSVARVSLIFKFLRLRDRDRMERAD